MDEVDSRVRNAGSNDIPVLSMTRHQGLILQNVKFEKRVASRDVNNYKVVRKGQIVYGFPMDEGVIFTLRKFDLGAVSPVYEVWKLSSDIVDIDFLDELLRTPLMISTYRRLTSNTVQRRRIVSKRDFKRITVSLPPLPEQKAIARVLSSIRKSIEAQDNIIAAARELKKSLMRHLFTYGPVPEAEHVILKETEIGPVPEHWDVVRMGELGEIITGTTPSTKVAEYYGGPHMFITPGDIYQTKYITKTHKYLSNKGLSVSRPLPHDTVLVVCIGATIGKTAMTSVDNSVTNQQINSIITNQRIEPHYCFYAVTHFSHLLPALAGRVAIPIVNKSNFSKFLIPLPPNSEQQEIAQILSNVDNKIEAEEKRKASLQALFRTMLHQLMTGKVRVKDLEATAA